MLTNDEKACLANLERFADRLRAVSALIQRGDDFRAQYADVKAALRAERDACAGGRSWKSRDLTAAEKRWYVRPIQHAAAHLIAPVNGSAGKVGSSVSEARSDLMIVISKMQAHGEGPKES